MAAYPQVRALEGLMALRGPQAAEARARLVALWTSRAGQHPESSFIRQQLLAATSAATLVNH